ncbi:sporulation protein YpjB [Alkalicoccobacillus gibsonii]|uniref:Sporulation protein YpjB n=1 Tax=Alkalicoccobacillus gibsonii TaxID=79881 RepID=A0ABU9VHS7_9BACI
MRYVKGILLFLVCFGWLGVQNVQASSESHWTDVSKTADLVLQLTKQENLTEANQLLESFNHTWQNVNHEQSPFFDTESEQAISLTLQQAQVALQSSDMEQVERVDRVTTFRLAVDAVSNNSQPLWLLSETSLLKAAEELKVVAVDQTSDVFYQQLNEINRQYQVIRPALSIQAASDLYFIDTQLDTFLSSKKQLDVGARTAYAAQLEEDIQTMYEEYDQEEADPSLWWMIFTIGGMIIVSLSYVGWRKYAASQVKHQEKEKEKEKM